MVHLLVILSKCCFSTYSTSQSEAGSMCVPKMTHDINDKNNHHTRDGPFSVKQMMPFSPFRCFVFIVSRMNTPYSVSGCCNKLILQTFKIDFILGFKCWRSFANFISECICYGNEIICSDLNRTLKLACPCQSCFRSLGKHQSVLRWLHPNEC